MVKSSELSVIKNIALIRNPSSRLNRKEDKEYISFAQNWLGTNYCAPTSIDEMMQAIIHFEKNQIQCIIIDGGDGTISQVMTSIYHTYKPTQLPYLVILPSGNTNLIAKDIGFGVRGIHALQRIKILSETQRLIRSVQHRYALKIEWMDSYRPAVLGMFQGALAFTKAIEIAHNPTILKNFSHDWAVAVTVCTTILKLILPNSRKAWLKGDLCNLKIDKDDYQEKDRFMFLSTTLNSLSNGVWPFWDDKNHDQYLVHYLSVDAYPEKLLRSYFYLLRGKAPQWLRSSRYYHSGNAYEIELYVKENFILDGEAYDTGPNHQIKLSIGPKFAFVRL